MKLKIEPLSKETLAGATEACKKCFLEFSQKNSPAKWFKFSLNHSKIKNDLFLRYYVAIKDDKVIGTTGLYEDNKKDRTAFWLGWFCVVPEERGHGFGKQILSFSVKEARKLGKKSLKLWTTTDPNEAVAQVLYEKMGFKIIKEIDEGKKYKTLHREIEL